MTLLQAALIGIFAYLGRNQVPWLFGTTGGFYGIGRPLVAGLIVGFILGDVKGGVLCGVAVQAIFIGQIVPGGALPSDLNLAAYVGIPLALISGGDTNTAVAFAVTLGAIGVLFHNLSMTLNSFWVHRADKYALNADVRQIKISNICGTLIPFIERFGIVTCTLYFGSEFAQSIITAMPESLTKVLGVAGSLLPALGFAILLNQVINQKWQVLLFVFGWAIMSSFEMTTTTVLIIAIAISALYVKSIYENSGKEVIFAQNVKEEIPEDYNYEE